MRKQVLAFVRLLGVSCIIFLILQWPIAREDRASLFEIAPFALALNLFIIAVPMANLLAFIRWRLTIVAGITSACILSALNVTKLHYLGEPVVANDIFILQLSPFMARYIGVTEIMLTLAFLVIISATIVSVRRVRITRAHAATLLLLNAIYLFLLMSGFDRESRLRAFVPVNENAKLGAINNGYLLSSVMRLQYSRIYSSANYSRESVEQALALAGSAPRAHPSVRRSNPDVVFILIESFYDYYRANKNWLREDNAPFYRSLLNESQHRYFYAPDFGGGTANSEYEALTGLTTAFAREAVPYEQYILHKVASVPALYKERGYHTLAIHNNFGSFWSRQRAYPLLGFSEFRSMERIREMLGAKEGEVPEDREIFRQSLEILTKSDRAPAFHFLITLHSHGPYPPSVAKQPRWVGAGTSLNPILSAEFETYLDTVHKTDEDLRWYFSNLKKLKNPPTVILFGDHHPYFTQYLQPNASMEDLHKIDVLFWNWRGGALPAAVNDLSCLAPLLARAGLDGDTKFFHFLGEFCVRFASARSWRPRSPEYDIWLEAYGTLTFDRLLGVQYSKE